MVIESFNGKFYNLIVWPIPHLILFYSYESLLLILFYWYLLFFEVLFYDHRKIDQTGETNLWRQWKANSPDNLRQWYENILYFIESLRYTLPDQTVIYTLIWSYVYYNYTKKKGEPFFVLFLLGSHFH